jgi:hypothetical protein
MKRAIALLVMIATLAVGVPKPAEALDIVVLGNGDFVATTPAVTLTRFFPNLRVSATATGDHEIFMPIPVTLGKKLLAVFVCYKTENAQNFIATTAVSEFTVPDAPSGLFSDATDQASTAGTCYAALAPGGGVVLAGSLLMKLTLHFGLPGQGIFIGATGAAFE